MTPDSDRTSVKVRIAGEEHVIRSNADPEYTRRCARFVDDHIVDIRQRSSLMEGHKAAILAALSITDRYFQARDELARLRSALSTRTGALLRRIEEETGGPTEG